MRGKREEQGKIERMRTEEEEASGKEGGRSGISFEHLSRGIFRYRGKAEIFCFLLYGHPIRANRLFGAVIAMLVGWLSSWGALMD
mmetsp:Transcript_12664/g.19660  ORF Transcript_12664/g.19660 Transcript_12664/m.19660 type:complete len:85 (-) Transcript_12664:235-489(-)